MNRKPIVLMLEDDSDRIGRFESVLAANGCGLLCYRTASSFIDSYCTVLQDVSLISLDHDLIPEGEYEDDPGDGREVSRFLATQYPHFHTIIHSSNFECAESMFFTLLEVGWDVEKVAPIGNDWIESYWWPIAKPWLRRGLNRDLVREIR